MRIRPFLLAALALAALGAGGGCGKSEESSTAASADGKAPGANDAGLSTAQGAARRGAPAGP